MFLNFTRKYFCWIPVTMACGKTGILMARMNSDSLKEAGEILAGGSEIMIIPLVFYRLTQTFQQNLPIKDILQITL